MGSLAFYALMIDEHFMVSYYETAFKLINRLSIIHFDKDGGIMKCYLTTPDNELQIG